MSLRGLLDHFDCMTVLPIRIDDIRDAIVGFGIQDTISFNEVDIDADLVRGFLHQYTVRTVPYGEPLLHSDIYFSQHLDDDWARLVCTKELVHILDRDPFRVRKAKDYERLIKEVASPLDMEFLAEHGAKALSDMIGTITALALLVPRDSREILYEQFQTGEVSEQEIAMLAGVPTRYIKTIMDEEFQSIVDRIVEMVA